MQRRMRVQLDDWRRVSRKACAYSTIKISITSDREPSFSVINSTFEVETADANGGSFNVENICPRFISFDLRSFVLSALS